MTKDPEEFEDIYIVEVIEDEVGVPRGDGTRGSALYDVPLKLSAPPPVGWSEAFRHYAGENVDVYGDRAVVRDTLLDRIAQGRERLQRAVERTNASYRDLLREELRLAEAEADRVAEHRRQVAEQVNGIKFGRPEE